MARFLPLIDWTQFRRVNLNEELRTSRPVVARFACGDQRQAVVWLLRRTTLGSSGRLREDVPPVSLDVEVPGLASGRYRVTSWDTSAGAVAGVSFASAADGRLVFQPPPFVRDLALAIRAE